MIGIISFVGYDCHRPNSTSSVRTDGAQRRQERRFEHEETFLQPRFLPNDVSRQIRRLLPNIHLMKMRHYFEEFGCIRCERRDILYASNGPFENCAPLIRGRVVTCLKKKLKSVGITESQQYDALDDCVSRAREILKGGRKGTTTPRQQPSLEPAQKY
jgi:hypothetical protein